MMMTPAVPKFALITHVTSSVGWLGAVAAFLALAVAVLGSQDPQIVRAADLAMHLTTWFVIVPLSLAALLTGIVQSFRTFFRSSPDRGSRSNVAKFEEDRQGRDRGHDRVHLRRRSGSVR